jgi:hypothetical protein
MLIARNLCLSLSLLLAAAFTSAHAQAKPELVDLFAPASPERNARAFETPFIPGMRPETIGTVSFVSLSTAGRRSWRSARAGAPQSFRIALPNASTVVCNVTPERRAGGVLAMHGTANDNNAFDHCNLYEENGRITGDIDVEGGRFAIVPVGDMHAIVEVKTQAFPNEGEPLDPPDVPPGRKAPYAALPTCDVPSPPGKPAKLLGPLRVMLVFTAPARSGINVASAVNELRDQINKAFTSNGNFKVSTEFMGSLPWSEVAYEEPHYSDSEREMYSQKAGKKLKKDMDVDLWRLTDKQDPTFQRVREMRDRYKADVVHLITMRDPNQNGCGLGWKVQDLGSLRDWGFSTSNRECALKMFSFVHEVGHNLGMNHDRGAPDVTPKPGEFNFGYVRTDWCVRSVMAYDDTCKDSCRSQPQRCRRLNIFSSPDLPGGTSLGRPANDPMAAYNAEVLCQAGTVLKDMRR